MSDDDLLFGWDDDRRWVWATGDDGWELDLPASASELLDRATTRGASTKKWLQNGVVLEVSDGESTREFGRREITDLLTMAGDALKTRDGAVDAEHLEMLAQGAALLATVLDAISQPDDADAPPDAELSSEVDALVRLCDECDRAPFLRVQPRRDGSFRLAWHDSDRELFDEFTAMLDQLLSSGSAEGDAARLFPAAYGDDDDRNSEWTALTRDELTDRRLAALRSAQEVMTRTSSDESTLLDLAQTLNSIRLVLGTRLDVSDEGEPRDRSHDTTALECFEYLGLLQYEVVSALSTVLPETDGPAFDP